MELEETFVRQPDGRLVSGPGLGEPPPEKPKRSLSSLVRPLVALALAAAVSFLLANVVSPDAPLTPDEHAAELASRLVDLVAGGSTDARETIVGYEEESGCKFLGLAFQEADTQEAAETEAAALLDSGRDYFPPGSGVAVATGEAPSGKYIEIGVGLDCPAET